MRTISIDVDEQVYPHLVELLRRLPAERCHVLDDAADDHLSADEHAELMAVQARLAAGDDSDFVDWDEARRTLAITASYPEFMSVLAVGRHKIPSPHRGEG